MFTDLGILTVDVITEFNTAKEKDEPCQYANPFSFNGPGAEERCNEYGSSNREADE